VTFRGSDQLATQVELLGQAPSQKLLAPSTWAFDQLKADAELMAGSASTDPKASATAMMA